MVLTVHLQPQCQVLNRRVLYHWFVYQSSLALPSFTNALPMLRRLKKTQVATER